MVSITQKKKIFQIVFFLAVVVSFQVLPVREARADTWGSNYAAALMKETLEKIRRHIEGVVLGAAKAQMIEMINRQVGLLIGGGLGGQPYFITNYRDFLYRTPAQETALYMNDFFTLNTRGKYSSANYLGVGDMRGVLNNYPGYLVALGKQATINKIPCVYNLDEYTPNPQAMFREGNFRALDAFVSNPCNNASGYTMVAEEVFQAVSLQNQQIAAVRAQSSGFLGVEKNGITITPAGAIEALSSMNVQNMGNVITAASNPSELSGVIAAVVNRSITALVRWGIGTVESNIQSQVNNVNRQVNTAINDVTRELGPAAALGNSVIRSVNSANNTGILREVPTRINGINGVVTIPPTSSSVDAEEALRNITIE